MRKIGLIIVLSFFLYSQVMLAGASVLCVTQDGQTHLERTDEHGHCIGRSDADCAAHIHDDAHSAVLCITKSQCHDIPLSQTSMAVMSAKRFSKIIDCDCQPQTSVFLDTTHRAFGLTGPWLPQQNRLTLLRTVVLLI